MEDFRKQIERNDGSRGVRVTGEDIVHHQPRAKIGPSDYHVFCCNNHRLPSGSLKSAYLTPPRSETSPTVIPRSRSASRAWLMSATTRWMPLIEPGFMSEIPDIPVPKTIAQADPGGVNWTTRMDSVT